MKLTKRMQNAIIQGFLVNIIFFILFLSGIIFFIYPDIKAFEVIKDELQVLDTSLKEVQKKGIGYQDFQTSTAELGLGTDLYYSSILSSIDEAFYTQHFQNIDSIDYSSFLKELEQKSIQQKSAPDYQEKNKTINQILPFYTGNRNEGFQGMNDFYFVNYIENLMYSFNLAAEGDIGVGQLQKYKKEGIIDSVPSPVDPLAAQNVITKNILQEDIYIIPLTFDISGRKSDILDFLHFFENVGSITKEGDELLVHKDTTLSQVLDGVKSQEGYNIYQNQIGVIAAISLLQYPDSSTFSSQSSYTSLVDMIRQDQSQEAYDLSLTLNFYVSGLPLYKVDQSITQLQEKIVLLSQRVLQDQNTLSAGVQKSPTESQKKLSFLSSFQATLQPLKSELEILKKQLTIEGEDTKIYEKVSGLQKRYEKMQEIYDSKMSTSLDKS